jgi:hypothetical protein
MASAIQLQFNFEEKTEEELKFDLLQNQIDLMNTSMEKVRKKLFAEISILKKLCTSLSEENKELKSILSEEKDGKTLFTYGEKHSLFDVQKHQETRH